MPVTEPGAADTDEYGKVSASKKLTIEWWRAGSKSNYYTIH